METKISDLTAVNTVRTMTELIGVDRRSDPFRRAVSRPVGQGLDLLPGYPWLTSLTSISVGLGGTYVRIPLFR